ncbi:MAG TPA: DNA polymerase III subunit gamma/tau, partial [Emticicia sp.]
TNQVNEPAPTNIIANKSFTLEQLKTELHTFADSRNNATLEVMLKREFNLIDGYVVKLRLDNQVQMDLLTQMKQDLAVYLRQQLQNNTIQIASEIVENQTERRPYTAQEKFEYLANKNPALWDLKEKLGMDLVF